MRRWWVGVVVALGMLVLAGPVAAQTTTFTVGNPNAQLFGGSFMGFGVELDPYFWNTPNTTPSVIGNPKNIVGVNATDWQTVTQRLKDLQIPVIRMGVQLGWMTRDPDLAENNWLWSNPQMQSVFKYLDFACANNIDVIIDDWAWTPRSWDEAGVSFPNCNQFPNNPGCYPANNGYVDETDPRFAQGIARYMKELVVNRGYSCVKYLAVANEPEYEFYAGNNRTYAQGLQIYETMIRNVNNALIANGMRSKIKFLGPGTGGGWDFMGDAIRDLHDVFDIYDFHRYPGPTCPYPQPPCSSEITNINPTAGVYGTLYRMLAAMRDIAQTNDPVTGTTKQMFVTEMGISSGDTLTTAGKNDYFEYALEMGDYGTTLLSTPVQGGTFWNAFDLYYSLDQNIYWNPPYYGENFFEWGLWKYKDNNWALRPSAQAWGLLTRFAPKNSVQAPVNGCPPCTGMPDGLPPVSTYRVGAVKRPDGGWSLFLVNETTSSQTFTLSLPSLPGHNFRKYVFDRNTLTAYPNMVAIPSVGTVTAAQNLNVAVPGLTFLVLAEDVSGGGQPTPTPTPTVVPGDANGDGHVDGLDYVIWLNHYGQNVSGASNGDFNNDGHVDGLDYVIWLNHYGV